MIKIRFGEGFWEVEDILTERVSIEVRRKNGLEYRKLLEQIIKD
jgi:hypothetical protein